MSQRVDNGSSMHDLLSFKDPTPGATEGDHGGCLICHKDDHHEWMLLCESCDGEYHAYCLTPKLDSIPKSAWYCDACASRRNDSELQEMMDKLSPEYTDRFGEICWAQGGVGYGWWPCCIYDPKWAKGKPLAEAKRHLGKRHLVYFSMCTEAPFALLPQTKIMSWIDGLADNLFQGRAAKAYSKERFALFKKALAVATTEFDKPKSSRLRSLVGPKKIAHPVTSKQSTLPSKIPARATITSTRSPDKSRKAIRVLPTRKQLRRPGETDTSGGGGVPVANRSLPRMPPKIESRKMPVATNSSTKLLSMENKKPEDDKELVCTVWKANKQDPSASNNIGFVILPSARSSTLEDVRNSISTEIDTFTNVCWEFFVPPLGPVSRVQERIFGPVLPFFKKIRLVPSNESGDGSVHDPLRIYILEKG